MIEPFCLSRLLKTGSSTPLITLLRNPFIYIKLIVSEGQIAINVINNTSLELENQAKKMQGKGLSNSKNVLELLYPDAYELDIIQTEKGDRAESKSRLKNAHERLQRLYPDTHTLDVILSNNTFTVSLILTNTIDKLHHYRR
jgi:LytS/YehU family sensor histidine kinase